MNKSNSASKIKMKSFDDLFGTNENLEQANANGGEIREIPLASLYCTGIGSFNPRRSLALSFCSSLIFSTRSP